MVQNLEVSEGKCKLGNQLHKYLKVLRFNVVKAIRLDISLGVHVIRKNVRTKTEPKGILTRRGWGNDEEASEK